MKQERDVIWIASFPKSGNTWVTDVLAVAGDDCGYPKGGAYDAYHLEANGLEPLVCRGLSVGTSDRPCSILKTHAPYDPGGLEHAFPGIEPVTRAFVHIYRNPLDVLLSYIGFTRLEYRLNQHNEDYRRRLFIDLLGFQEPVSYQRWRVLGIDNIDRRHLDHALDVFSGSGMAIPTIEPMSGSWIEHWRSWVAAGSELPGCSLRYEDCIADRAVFARLRKLFPIEPSKLRHAVDYVHERALMLRQHGAERDRIFYGKQASYYFTSYFSHAALERFFSSHGEVLHECGYGNMALIGGQPR